MHDDSRRMFAHPLIFVSCGRQCTKIYLLSKVFVSVIIRGIKHWGGVVADFIFLRMLACGIEVAVNQGVTR